MRWALVVGSLGLTGCLATPPSGLAGNLDGGAADDEDGDPTGSGTLVRSLLRDGLLDELHLLVHPIVVGSGKRLFPDGSQLQALDLVDAQTFSTGVLSLTYKPAGDEKAERDRA